MTDGRKLRLHFKLVSWRRVNGREAFVAARVKRSKIYVFRVLPENAFKSALTLKVVDSAREKLNLSLQVSEGLLVRRSSRAWWGSASQGCDARKRVKAFDHTGEILRYNYILQNFQKIQFQ